MKYFAFISYNSKDTVWGKRVQKKLERYRLPSTLCSEHGWKRRPMNPIFFAPTDIQPGGLSAELQERLRSSRHLIVICSPNSAQSEWVGKEIEYFHSLGRTENIHFFIVRGIPNSGDPETECFNPIINQLGLPEILGANIHEKIYLWPWLNKERAYAQLISKLLGVEFDTIWQRHKRMLRRKAAIWIAGGAAVAASLFGIWLNGQPFDATIRLNEASVHNANIPTLRNAIVTLTLDNETKTGTVSCLDSCVVFTNIPHRYLNKEVRFSVVCRNCWEMDTLLPLTSSQTLDLYRNDTVFGKIHFRFWSSELETTYPGVAVSLAGHEAVSDDTGYVNMFIPLREQCSAYCLSCALPLLDDTIHMPCGQNDILLVQ